MLEIEDLAFAFETAPTIARVSLTVEPGEFVVVLGPSGCGKTTLLRLAAGALVPSSGRLSVDGARRAFVFQEPRLAPWLDAVDNAAFGLKALGVPAGERRNLARDLLMRLGLQADDLRKLPATLSGGMRQRVAIARALSIRPQLLLMDEPFAALDVGLRRRLQDLIVAEATRSDMATLFVTHDVAEAVRLASRIVVLSPRPAQIVADLPNVRVREPAQIYAAAADLLRCPEIARALLNGDSRPCTDSSETLAPVQDAGRRLPWRNLFGALRRACKVSA